MSERILRQEREAAKTKGKKGKRVEGEEELDLPEAAAGPDEGKQTKKDEKSAEVALRKAKAGQREEEHACSQERWSAKQRPASLDQGVQQGS